MAYRTVNPYAFGKLRHLSALSLNLAAEYTYAGLPTTSTHFLAVSAVRKTDCCAGEANNVVEVDDGTNAIFSYEWDVNDQTCDGVMLNKAKTAWMNFMMQTLMFDV